MIRRKFNLFLSLLLCISCYTKAQENLAYTRYALGALSNQNFAGLSGFGNISAAYNNSSTLNLANPASLGFLQYTTFDIGGLTSVDWIKSQNEKTSGGSGTFDYLALGFPVIKKHWSASFGLAPFSRTGYGIDQYKDSTNALGSDKDTYTGSGGVSQVFIGNGFRWKNFSVGIKVAYLFGNITYTNTLEFVDTINGYNTGEQQTRRPGGILCSGGAQWNIPIGKKYQLCFGVDGNLTSSVTSRRDLIFYRFQNSESSGVLTQVVKDTVYSEINQRGTIVIPMQIDGGIIFKKLDKFTVGVQFHYGAWSQYRSFGSPDSTANNWQASIGGELTPNSKDFDNYFHTVRYRFGAYYGTNYLKFAGSNFYVYGITAGVGFPIRKSLSLMNISFDVGQSGNENDNLIRQIYFRGTIGFSIADIWFLKRKYD